MRIAVIGAGAMGSIYGGLLSKHNEVFLIDKNPEIISVIKANGLTIEQDGIKNLYQPKAVTETDSLGTMDLVILFVKALYSEAALTENTGLIGSSTYLMTLQNGAGHENLLLKFAPKERIIIGTTEDNGTVLAPGVVRRGGSGRTNIGMITEDITGGLEKVSSALDEAGFTGIVHENIQKLIWKKLFINISLSAVTGLLQCPIGGIAGNIHAGNMAGQLIDEAALVSSGLGLDFDTDEIKAEIYRISTGSPEGITSICMDLRSKRRTEVDTISGAVIKAAEQLGLEVPVHRFLVEMVHAMEEM